MESYNLHLYHTRLNKGMKRKEFAKFLHLAPITYKRIEQGYLKPTKKQIAKISAALKEDFTIYTLGEYSYPIPLNENYEGKFAKWWYELIGKLWVRITVFVLLLISFSVFGVGFYYGDVYQNQGESLYTSEYIDFINQIKEKGTPTISLTNDMIRAEIFIQDETRFYSMKVSYKENNPTSYVNVATYHIDDYRISYVVRMLDNPMISVTFADYNTGDTHILTYSEATKDEYTFLRFSDELSSTVISDEEQAVRDDIQTKVEANIHELNPYFDSLIEQKLGLSDYKFYENVCNDFALGNKEMNHVMVISLFLIVMGTVTIAGSLFAIAYCFIYGRKKGTEAFYKDEYLPSVINTGTRAKKDFFFTPFLPETLFEIIGIALVGFGSVRVLYYIFTFLGTLTIAGDDFTTIPNTLLSLFMLGMFLLYFIDFDIFLDDKRLFRNIFLYFIVFIVLYALESVIMTALNDSNSIMLMELAANISPPNNFGTITCYFLMMLTLFYTPKRIQSHKVLVLYRLLTIIPVGIIITNTIIYNCANTLWGWNLPVWTLYIFSSERIQFSLLCVSFLLALYFLKLYYVKKYGEDKARILMNGNRFLCTKNIIGALIVLVIGSLELGLANSPNAHALGLGKYPYLIYCAPLILLYHPHMGKRNKAVDYTTMTFYALALCGAYLVLLVPFIILIIVSL